MFLGYNTNGFAHHRIEDALRILADMGYTAVAVTLEPTFFHPPDAPGVRDCVKRLSSALAPTHLLPTIETGSRFILDSNRKHHPTLVSARPEDRQRRIDFICAAIDIAAEIGAAAVSLWSGRPDDVTPDHAHSDEVVWERLTVSLEPILRHAESRRIRLAFEPEPDMFIDAMTKFDRLHQSLPHPLLGLTLDVGHVHCLEDGRPADHIRRWKHLLWNIHIEDMRRGRHEHLLFGQGDMDFPPIFSALREIRYDGPLHVELSRHSHDAVNLARLSFEFLKRMVEPTSSP